MSKRCAALIALGLLLAISTGCRRREASSSDRANDATEFTADFYGMKYLGRNDNVIDQAILRYGAFEKPLLYFMRDLIRAVRPEGCVFVDVGANTGQHSLFMSKYCAEVHAFEPYEPVLKRFRDMIHLNEIDNITVHPVGLGSGEAKLPFYEPPGNNPGMGSFVPGFSQRNSPYRELQIVTGDRALADAHVDRVDLVKIDIEGYEKPALEGLRETLETSRPVVVLEVTLDPPSDISFRSEADLRSAFPSGYELLRFVPPIINATGSYALTELGDDFANAMQQLVVAYPRAIGPNLPRSYAGDRSARE